MMEREAVVIGGGLAGAAIAALLVAHGRDVLLLEKETGPHHKVCGEFISWEAVHYLNRLKIDLAALGAKSIDNLQLNWGKKHVRLPLPFRAASLSRLKLDEAVLDKARDAGAEIRRGVTVTSLEQGEKNWRIETAQGDVIQASTVFLASGKSDLRGLARPSTPQSNLIGFKMHFHLSDDQILALQDQVEMLFFDGGYAGLELVEDNIANLCLLVSKEKYQQCQKSWPVLLEWLQEASAQLKQRLNGATSLWPKPLAVFGMPYGYLYKANGAIPLERNLYRLGDQMGVISSFAGDGMSMALHSAFTAAGCYLSGKDENSYYKIVYRDFKRPVKLAYWIAAFALKKRLHPLLSLISTWPKILNWASRGVRLDPRHLDNDLPRST